MSYQSALDQFRQVGVHNQVHEADPHTLIAMLLDGLLERLAHAKGCMMRGDTAGRGELMGKSIAIVDSLRASLNHEQGGELSKQLLSLYDHMELSLLQANKNCDQAALAEVSQLVREIKEGWDGIAPHIVKTAGETVGETQ